MKKLKPSLLLAAALAAAMLAGCTSSKSFTYNVETGDAIEITCDTSGGYNLSSEIPFKVSGKDGDSHGTFVFANAYEGYEEVLEAQEGVKVLDSGEKDGSHYVSWSYNDTEFNYLILVGGSETGVILGNRTSEASAKDIFGRLSFKKIP